MISKSAVVTKGCGCFLGAVFFPVIAALVVSGVFFVLMSDYAQLAQVPGDRKINIDPPSSSDRLSMEEKFADLASATPSASRTFSMNYRELNAFLYSLKFPPNSGLIVDKMAVSWHSEKVYISVVSSGLFQPKLNIQLEMHPVIASNGVILPLNLVSGKLNSLEIREGWRFSLLSRYYSKLVKTFLEEMFINKPFELVSVAFASDSVKMQLSPGKRK
ncbi:MAG: hypothetical protein HQM10_01725 [Candidatus Riflebacteria bacterium]|nr:hypothetical protein [Candidatus Riflebacteria bacterium]